MGSDNSKLYVWQNRVILDVHCTSTGYLFWMARRSFHAGSIPVSARIFLPTVNTRAPDKYSAQILTNTRHKCEHISLTFPAMEPLFIVTGGRRLERQETDKYLPLSNSLLSHTSFFSWKQFRGWWRGSDDCPFRGTDPCSVDLDVIEFLKIGQNGLAISP